jgi:hypothetical protein
VSGTDYTTTPNHGFYLPVYNADSENWGYHLVDNWTAVDGLLATTGAGALFLPLAGGSMKGVITQPTAPVAATDLANKAYVDAHAFTDAPNNTTAYGRLGGAWASVLPIAGGSLTGALTLAGDPSAAQQAATKNYVDTRVGSLLLGAVVSDGAPASPSPGELWFSSTDAQLYVWYPDPNSSQWVAASNAGTVSVTSFNARTGAVTLTPADLGSAGGLHDTGRNYLHNGLMNIAQRGAGPWSTVSYTADRWWINLSGDTSSAAINAAVDADRSSIGDEACRYTLGVSIVGTAAATALTAIQQRIESVRRLAGKTVTVSFWANATAGLRLGVSLDQGFGTGGSPSPEVDGNGQAVTLTSAYARYSLTFVLPSAAGKTLGTNGNDWTALNFWYSSGSTNAVRSGNVGVQSGGINLWGVQLEAGSTATPLEKLDPQQDLAKCNRFFYAGAITSAGYQISGTTIIVPYSLPVNMRGTPTLVITGSAGSVNIGSAAMSPGNNGRDIYASATSTVTGQNTLAYTFTASADL